MRILILTIYHDPEPIPKTGELARELQRLGHEVTVVTSFPHYPSGELYTGYRLRPWQWETRDGVRILRTFIYPYHGTRASLRMLNYVSWMFSSMAAAWLAPRCDVIYVWHPPLTVGVTAWVLGKLKRAPVVYDVQDLWPESAEASGLLKPGRLVNMLHRLADWVYARVDRVLVVSNAAREYLVQRGVDANKIRIAHHWIDETAFDGPASGRDVRSEYGFGNQFLVLFAGNLGLVQGLETVIDAADRLRDTNIRFLLVGDGSDRERLEQDVRHRQLSNVIFAGRHSSSAMPDFYRSVDALLVHLRPSLIAGLAIPSKVLAYLAAAKPIICAVPGATAELIRAAGAGLVVAPGHPDELATAIRQLASTTAAERADVGERGPQYLNQHFRREHVIGEYAQILQDAARRAIA
jgi:glycosyltransferase involved in cell wall biosynthesis